MINTEFLNAVTGWSAPPVLHQPGNSVRFTQAKSGNSYDGSEILPLMLLLLAIMLTAADGMACVYFRLLAQL